MKKFLQGTAAALGLLAALAVGASAQETQPAPQDEAGRPGRHKGLKRDGMRRRGPGHGLRALGRLNLSDAQREQLRVLSEGLHQRTEAQRNELRQLGRARREGGQLTDEQRQRARQLHEELRQSHETHRQQVLGVLTPEQRAQLEQLQQERQQRREERRQRREEFRRRQGQGETL
jgi:Spy/CpxP family protein refolding chaperone